MFDFTFQPIPSTFGQFDIMDVELRRDMLTHMTEVRDGVAYYIHLDNGNRIVPVEILEEGLVEVPDTHRAAFLASEINRLSETANTLDTLQAKEGNVMAMGIVRTIVRHLRSGDEASALCVTEDTYEVLVGYPDIADVMRDAFDLDCFYHSV